MNNIRQFIVYLLSLFFLIATASGQEVEVKKEREYTGVSLYNFLEKGAGKFQEYGVSRLISREVVYKGKDFTIDIYETPSPADAFGIYSLHTFGCERVDTLDCINCLSSDLYQAVSGNKYISVSFLSGNMEARECVDELVRMYLPMNKRDNPEFPVVLGLDYPYSDRLKYLKGPISVSATSSSLSELLVGITYTSSWFIWDKSESGHRALIYFSDKNQLKKLKEKAPATSLILQGDDFLFFSGV